MAQRRRYTEAEDEADDRRRGIREGSPRDARLDRSRNLPADRLTGPAGSPSEAMGRAKMGPGHGASVAPADKLYGQRSGDTWRDLRNLPLSPQGERTLAGFRARYQNQGDQKFYEAIRNGTLSQSMWAGNSKPTDPAERSNAGLAGANKRGGAGMATDTTGAPSGLRTFSRDAGNGGGGEPIAQSRAPRLSAAAGSREPGFGGPSGSSATVASGKQPLAAAYGKKPASHGNLAGLNTNSRV